MFKNLSMWLYEQAPDGEQAIIDTGVLNDTVRDHLLAIELINDHPPINPGHGQVKRFGLAPMDELIIEQSVGGVVSGGFLPLTQVIRERVVDTGAVKFEVEQRVNQIFMIDGRHVGRKELISIKDEVIQSMLKDAPIREKRVFGIVTSFGKILVNATGKAAEEYISYVKSLFGDFIRVRSATLAEWNREAGFDSDNEDFVYLTEFALDRINNTNYELGTEKNAVLEQLGSFSFTHGDETIAVKHGGEATVEEILPQLSGGYVDWIELAHEHAVFKLTSDLTLKSIKLQDLEYTPENDEETGLSAAYYRFYMNFFINLFDTVVSEVAKVNHDV